MSSLRDLALTPIWVNPKHLVSTASHIMAGHGVRALGVLDGSRLIGIIDADATVRAPEGATVGLFMRAAEPVVQITDSIRSVAARFGETNRGYMPVLDGETFVGIVTPNMLLREMGRSFDPLSRLSWSDRLREWGMERLQRGDEITILFIDLNDFGQYNKRHGHVVGDAVIREFAATLEACVDPMRDVLVRYGGDEFAIGTIRARHEAETLAELIRRRAGGIVVEPGVEPVSFALGIFGGRRGQEREDTHYAATLDNLINCASKAALASKPSARAEAQVDDSDGRALPDLRVSPAVRVIGVYADEIGPRPVTTVILSVADSVVSGAASPEGDSLLEAAAWAAARALEQRSPDLDWRLDRLRVSQGVLEITGEVTRGGVAEEFRVERPVGDDPLLAAAEAAVDALAGRN